MNKTEKFVSGFITIIGRPNVGKSTLLNNVLGTKITITSDKPQTTRNTIQGVYTKEDCQLVFIDTPGIHKPLHELGKTLIDMAYGSISGVDAVLFMTSCEGKIGLGDKMIIEHLKKIKLPVYLVLNKIDLLKSRAEIDLYILDYMNEFEFAGVYPISAKENINVDKLLLDLKAMMPEGPKYFPDDQITDHPERFIISELIREKILYFTKEEVPHSVAVVIESMKPNLEDKEYIDVYATIFVERDSQKRIIIGKGGELMKKVKELARRDVKSLLGTKIHLDLWVKVKKDWRNKATDLRIFGYSNDNY